MNTFSTVAAAAKAALVLLNTDPDAPAAHDLTGKVYMDMNSEALWFQVEDDTYHVTNWISMDFPEYAAPGETLVVATDEREMLHFDEDRQPPATYSVGASDVEGLEPDEALYTGLTRDVARATLDGVIDLGEPEKYNYWMKREPRP